MTEKIKKARKSAAPAPKKAATQVAIPDDVIANASLDAYVRAEAIIDAINANLPSGARQLEPIPKGYVLRRKDKEAASVALHAAFELRGGVPALIAWSHDNPSSFYQLWGKLVQSETETPIAPTTINIVSAVPSNPLDAVTIDETGQVVDVDFDEVP